MMDRDRLEELEDYYCGVRAVLSPELSDVYVPGEGGNPQVMIIGAAPSAQEEIKRRPFVGPDGKVLRQLMSFAGLFTGNTPHFGEANCWLTYVVKYRPPGNRSITPLEVAGFKPLLYEEWVAIGQPQIIITVGKAALATVKGRHCPRKPVAHISREGMRIVVWPMISPLSGLRDESQIPLIEQNWAAFGEWFSDDGQDYPEWQLG